MAAPIMRGATGRSQMSRDHTICRAIPPHSCTILWAWDKRKEGLEFRTMEMTKATEQKQDSGRKYTNLDNRYGKIGISAVAAAVCHQGGQRHTTEAHLEPYDRD
jgi:hypothetical protein